MIKAAWLLPLAIGACGCAAIGGEPPARIAFSFSDGAGGQCSFRNRRGHWETPIPATIAIAVTRRPLAYDCEAEDGRRVFGEVIGELRERYVIPMPPPVDPASQAAADSQI
jgi:hypothetical protein